MEYTSFTGLILVTPILLVRFLLLSFSGKDSLKRAAFYPPTEGIEKVAYLVNILTSLVLFQLSVHLLIISEERWCLNQFGQPYIDYKEKVRRYI